MKALGLRWAELLIYKQATPDLVLFASGVKAEGREQLVVRR
jgi:hypothetical protein